MMLTQNRPIIVGDAPTDRNHEFLFIEGDRIVGRVYANCAVCAWKGATTSTLPLCWPRGVETADGPMSRRSA